MSLLLEDDELELVPNNHENVVNEDEKKRLVSKIFVGGGALYGSTGETYEAFTEDITCNLEHGFVEFTDLFNNRHTVMNAPITIHWDTYTRIKYD